jgi:zinc finger HIT domain-containing protein 1
MATPSTPSASSGVATSKSSRAGPAREVNRRVLDDATRQRRARKALESLEQDNFHDDPHADLVMSKKALNLFAQEDDDEMVMPMNTTPNSARKTKKKGGRSKEYYRLRSVVG